VDLSAGVTVQQRVDTFVGPGGTSARQVQTNASFWQSEYALNFPLARRDSRVAPKIKLAASRELFLGGLPSHEITGFILPESRNACNRAVLRFPLRPVSFRPLETSGFFSDAIFANLAA
jgi:hypothetical protein